MLFGGYIIKKTLSVITSCHSLSNTYISSKHRVAEMLKNVNKTILLCKYNYFLLVSTVIIVNILLHAFLVSLSFYYIITMIIYRQLSIIDCQQQMMRQAVLKCREFACPCVISRQQHTLTTFDTISIELQ